MAHRESPWDALGKMEGSSEVPGDDHPVVSGHLGQCNWSLAFHMRERKQGTEGRMGTVRGSGTGKKAGSGWGMEYTF